MMKSFRAVSPERLVGAESVVASSMNVFVFA